MIWPLSPAFYDTGPLSFQSCRSGFRHHYAVISVTIVAEIEKQLLIAILGRRPPRLGVIWVVKFVPSSPRAFIHHSLTYCRLMVWIHYSPPKPPDGSENSLKSEIRNPKEPLVLWGFFVSFHFHPIGKTWRDAMDDNSTAFMIFGRLSFRFVWSVCGFVSFWGLFLRRVR